MNTELLKEAVGYADGFKFVRPNVIHIEGGMVGRGWSKAFIAALASQLIEQVDAMDGINLISTPNGTDIYIGTGLRTVSEAEGPNRNDNSIRACVEFMRGRG